MSYVYLVFVYSPKHKYGIFIYEGHYKPIPLVFATYDSARSYCRSCKHATFIRRCKLR